MNFIKKLKKDKFLNFLLLKRSNIIRKLNIANLIIKIINKTHFKHI